MRIDRVKLLLYKEEREKYLVDARVQQVMVIT